MFEVGEHVRTKKYGDIGKLLKITSTKIYLDSIGYPIDKDEIAKHSKNIINLIEVGDYVNGYRVLEKTKIKNNEMQICILKDNNCSNWRTVNDKTLKSIVTKEQFASMEYRVKDE